MGLPAKLVTHRHRNQVHAPTVEVIMVAARLLLVERVSKIPPKRNPEASQVEESIVEKLFFGRCLAKKVLFSFVLLPTFNNFTGIDSRAAPNVVLEGAINTPVFERDSDHRASGLSKRATRFAQVV